MTAKPPAGHFRLLYFASAATFTKKISDDFSAPLPIVELFDVLENMYPGIGHAILISAAITVNLDYVDIEGEGNTDKTSQSTVIGEGDEVAIIPPVSSG